jgi:hypothetical protein
MQEEVRYYTNNCLVSPVRHRPVFIGVACGWVAVLGCGVMMQKACFACIGLNELA